jgi:Family of unknown function (DUF6173)
MPVSPPKMDGNLASGFYDRLVEWITAFQDELDSETEVGVRLVSFGQSLTFHLRDMSWYNPSLIRFDGVDPEGQEVQLIQHVSQISVLLMRVPKLSAEAKRIGFHVEDDGDAAGADT